MCRRISDDRGRTTEDRYSQNRRVVTYLSSVVRRPLKQILLGHGAAEAIIVLDEIVDEFVQPALENILDLAVFQPGSHGAGVALRRALQAVGLADAIEILHQILVAVCQ